MARTYPANHRPGTRRRPQDRLGGANDRRPSEEAIVRTLIQEVVADIDQEASEIGATAQRPSNVLIPFSPRRRKGSE